MNDYTSLLARVAERADPTTLPAPERIRAAVARRRRRAAAVSTAAAIAAIAVGAAALGSGPLRQEPAPAVDTPTPVPSNPVSPAYGEPVTVQPGLPHLDLHAVTYHEALGGGNSVYIVVGDSSADAPPGGEAVPHPIWWSEDARTWHHATTGPEESNVWDVTAYGGGFVAVAPHGEHSSTAWCSADGDQWFQADVPDDFHVFAVSSTDDAGLLAWGGNKIFVSSGCLEWGLLANAPDPTGATVCFVEEIDGQVVLGASTPQGRPSAWVLDGNAWRSRPSLTSLEPDWCRQHETAQSSAVGPAGTVSVRPGGDYPNTVFIRQD